MRKWSIYAVRVYCLELLKTPFLGLNGRIENLCIFTKLYYQLYRFIYYTISYWFASNMLLSYNVYLWVRMS